MKELVFTFGKEFVLISGKGAKVIRGLCETGKKETPGRGRWSFDSSPVEKGRSITVKTEHEDNNPAAPAAPAALACLL